MNDKYKTATAFRRALEERVRSQAQKTKTDVQRLYRHVAFDRFLCRVFHKKNAPYVLKGGYAMELRIGSARMTMDIDLSLPSIKLISANNEKEVETAIFEHLRESTSVELPDYFQFVTSPPISSLDAAPYGGARFLIESRIDGRTFVKFHLDVGVGDRLLEPLEWLECEDWLGFAGILPQSFPTISKEQQFAEKIHAYTLPRLQGQNSRTKDLVDMVLLVRSQEMKSDRISKAISATFQSRGTHAVPEKLELPPESWEKVFDRLVTECGLEVSMSAAFSEVLEFYVRLKLGQSR